MSDPFPPQEDSWPLGFAPSLGTPLPHRMLALTIHRDQYGPPSRSVRLEDRPRAAPETERGEARPRGDPGDRPQLQHELRRARASGAGLRERRHGGRARARERRPRDRGGRGPGRLDGQGRPGGHPRLVDRTEHPGVRDARRIQRPVRRRGRGARGAGDGGPADPHAGEACRHAPDVRDRVSRGGGAALGAARGRGPRDGRRKGDEFPRSPDREIPRRAGPPRRLQPGTGAGSDREGNGRRLRGPPLDPERGVRRHPGGNAVRGVGAPDRTVPEGRLRGERGEAGGQDLRAHRRRKFPVARIRPLPGRDARLLRRHREGVERRIQGDVLPRRAPFRHGRPLGVDAAEAGPLPSGEAGRDLRRTRTPPRPAGARLGSGQRQRGSSSRRRGHAPRKSP